MMKHFIEGCLDGVCWLIVGLTFIVMCAITFGPIALALIQGSAWWLLSYIIIVPFDFGIYNIMDNFDI